VAACPRTKEAKGDRGKQNVRWQPPIWGGKRVSGNRDIYVGTSKGGEKKIRSPQEGGKGVLSKHPGQGP